MLTIEIIGPCIHQIIIGVVISHKDTVHFSLILGSARKETEGGTKIYRESNREREKEREGKGGVLLIVIDKKTILRIQGWVMCEGGCLICF